MSQEATPMWDQEFADRWAALHARDDEAEEQAEAER